ncbi:hypothetical protein CB0940_03422 [Cercospora beticola]|uniref:Inhibitor I9 domain-containing protein n=1 Tax=Cercospora beticola TaxID=122368 RepID=A0A2G5I2F9_CERBT|nr:hypothetical protein CB0940_03422 [Cercospora beticola]PIA98986.1 hypothetical protein CB0940_03422 [Cercospora beticola]WPB00598.1 hypothetical protein RHO25_005218 [Cercospora beticola]CAK1361184.1 unnamed protein product [Cercospora beticola]
MKLVISSLLLALLAIFAAAAVEPKHQVIISYPKDTPASIMEDAKKAIIEAGGFITHEYHLITAIAATVPAKILDTIQAAGAGHNVLIEEDGEVSINAHGALN